MNKGFVTFLKIFLIVVYSGIWFSMLFIIVGFFMPNPSKFGRILFKKRKRKYYSSSSYPSDDDILDYEIMD